MILVDTSVWVEHLRRGSADLSVLLEGGDVVCHPFITGELALGQLRNRSEILAALVALPAAPVVDHEDVLTMVEHRGLAGSGIGWVDAHMLASALLVNARVWTFDRRLASAARRLSIDWTP